MCIAHTIEHFRGTVDDEAIDKVHAINAANGVSSIYIIETCVEHSCWLLGISLNNFAYIHYRNHTNPFGDQNMPS